MSEKVDWEGERAGYSRQAEAMDKKARKIASQMYKSKLLRLLFLIIGGADFGK